MKLKILQAFSQKIKKSIFFFWLCVAAIAVFLNIFFILLTDYKQNFVRTHDELNSEHVSLIAENSDLDLLENSIASVIDRNSEIIEYETNRVFHAWCSCDFGGAKMESHFCFMSLEQAQSKTIGKFDILSQDQSEDGVLLPYIFKTSGSFQIGDLFSVSNGITELSLPVAGFFSNVMSATQNCGYITVLYSENAESDVRSFFGNEKVLCGIRLGYPDDNTKTEMRIANEICKETDGTSVPVTNKFDSVFGGRYVVETISIAIICGLVVLIAVMTMFIISSSMASFIADNKSMFGIFNALGYTTSEIISVIFPALLILIVLALSCGIAVSYLVFPYINTALESQTGLPYKLSFQLFPAALTLCLPTLCIFLTIAFTLEKLTHITPLDAISERTNHVGGFRKSVSVNKLRMPLNLVISLNNMFENVRRTVLVVISTFLVAFLCTFASSLLQNILINDTGIAELVLGELADSTVIVPEFESDEFMAYLDSCTEVSNYVGYYVTAAEDMNNEYLSAVVVDDASRLENKTYCYEGRLPKNKGETAVGGKYASERDLAIGDTITMSFSGKETELEICGFTQSAKYLGTDAVITKETYEDVIPLQIYQYYIYLEHETYVADFNKKLSEHCHVLFMSDMRSGIEGMEETYFSGIRIICRIMIVVSFLMILMVLYILMRNLIENKKRDFGIMMALGYTTRSVMIISALTYLPAILIGILAGIVLSFYTFNPIMSVMLGSIGIKKCSFEIPLIILMIVGVSIMLISFAFTVIFSGKIKKTDIKEQILN